MDRADAPSDGRGEHPLTHDERAELVWLRAENALLRMEKEILVKTATWFAEEANAVPRKRTSRPEDR